MNNEKTYKYILFDLDGTLINTSPGIKESLYKMKQQLNLEKLDMDDINKFIGPPLSYSFGKYLELKDDELNKAVEVFRYYYSHGGQENAELYDGVVEVLKYLEDKGYKLGVATLKLEEKAYQVLELFGIKQYFNIVCGASPDLKEASKKEIILKSLEYFNRKNNENAILIGDSIYDMTGAEDAGIDFMPVSYGFGCGDEYEKEIKNSDFIINEPVDIKKYL